MITKTYQALNYQTYDMYVDLKGKRVLASFRGGSLKPPVNGTFQTSDPDLQAALEKDTSNGISFKEVSAFDDEEPIIETDVEETVVPEITTVQAARDYLVSHIDGLTAASLPNKTAVLAIAEKNKFVFPDLK